jgi:peptide deformylase
MNTMEEGCLSIPDVFARVVRPAEIVVSYQNELGEEEKQNLDGLTARVFQHELDHLDGILFIDRIGPFARQRAFEKAKKIQKMRRRGKEKFKARFAL